MKLTEAETNLILNQRKARQAKLGKFGYPNLDADNQPTGEWTVTEKMLEAMVDEITDARGHTCYRCSCEDRY